ncbi:hypothetical protein Mgra_00000998 [Meloidogyne graminicola]|uniref:Programmed cell death protein 5 n=1 Tax=Meloidogyne graminicola TaxID=189291 RepID=A0A8T0A294_9BILA|nr:hypothetical protein Mgra_00000998 [Meloidogyne graminicola]
MQQASQIADGIQNNQKISNNQTNVGDNSADSKRAEEQKQQQEMMRNTILAQVLDKSALARLSNLSVAKPEKSQAVENMIINMARMGQIRGKMSDEDLKKLLDKIADKTTKSTKVNYDRRRAAIDSDDEDGLTGQSKKGDESSDED